MGVLALQMAFSHVLEALVRLVLEVLVVFPGQLISPLVSLLYPGHYKRKSFSAVFLTGASSGLGAALARSFAGPGVRLTLTARRKEKLEEVAADCKELGADVCVVTLDVSDLEAVGAAIAAADKEKPLDLVIANAGVSLGMLNTKDLCEATQPITQVNVNGVYATVCAAVPLMVKRRKGQIAIMSSLAGFAPMADEPAYSASKAAVRTYGEAIRPLLKPYNVGMTVLSPGFIASGDITNKLTKGKPQSLPFVVSEEKAIAIMKDGIERNVGVVAYPFTMRTMTNIFGGIPVGLRTVFYNNFNMKRAARALVGIPAGADEHKKRK